MDTVEVLEKDLEKRFFDNEIVFKITFQLPDDEEEKDYGMVTTFSDYVERIRTHRYTPLFHFVPLETRIAYLFNCLNVYYGIPRKGTFRFFWREFKTKEWKPWFNVHPYRE